MQTIQFPFIQRKLHIFLAKQCRVEQSPVHSTLGLNMEEDDSQDLFIYILMCYIVLVKEEHVTVCIIFHAPHNKVTAMPLVQMQVYSRSASGNVHNAQSVARRKL